MKHLTIKEQLRREQRKNEMLTAENERLKADIEYLAMMTDVELTQEGEVESDDEIREG